MSTFINDSHLRSAHREATAAFQLEVAASATLLGIQHKILPFYYIMCKQDITYCLTSEGRGKQGILAHLGAQFTQRELCMKTKGFQLFYVHTIYKFVLYTSLYVLPLNPHLVAT